MAKNGPEGRAMPTRDRIVDAARKLFAEQGYQGTTIADISRLAGISEAGIYEYFRGKEELLLSIPDEWVSQAHHELEEHLFGIVGAMNKLRKFLWWYLRYVERTELNAKIVFLYLKTSRSFMDSPVYLKVQAFYRVIVDIVEEGQANGEIRTDISPFTARSMILGTIEHNAIRWLLKDRSYSLFDNLEQVYMMLRDSLLNPAHRQGERTE